MITDLKHYTIAFTIAIILTFVFILSASAEDTYTNEQIANAIYQAEGGKGYDYGIKSVSYKDEAEARQICLNTIRNQDRIKA